MAEWINNQTEENCLDAVKRCGKNLKFVKNQTEEICKFAVQERGKNIKYVNKQTEEICKIAVADWPYNLKYVNDITPELLKIAMDSAMKHCNDIEAAAKFISHCAEFAESKRDHNKINPYELAVIRNVADKIIPN
jgi:hypothetical protein